MSELSFIHDCLIEFFGDITLQIIYYKVIKLKTLWIVCYSELIWNKNNHSLINVQNHQIFTYFNLRHFQLDKQEFLQTTYKHQKLYFIIELLFRAFYQFIMHFMLNWNIIKSFQI